MHRVSLVAAILLAATGLVGGQQVFRAKIDLVHFGVVVIDRSGAPVLGLTPEDFEVVEDGKPQAIKFFAGGEPESAPPLHLGFMIDNSGSMAEDIRDVRTAAIRFLNTVENIIDVTLTDFDTEVRVARFGLDDFPRLGGIEYRRDLYRQRRAEKRRNLRPSHEISGRPELGRASRVVAESRRI